MYWRVLKDCLLNHISIPDHLNLCESLHSNVKPPICRADLPTVIFSYDHLEGVNRRHQLNATTETTLLSALSYFKTVEELGGQVSLALQKVNVNFRVQFYCEGTWTVNTEHEEFFCTVTVFSDEKMRALHTNKSTLHCQNSNLVHYTKWLHCFVTKTMYKTVSSVHSMGCKSMFSNTQD